MQTRFNPFTGLPDYIADSGIEFKDGPDLDAFGRLRVSTPFTLFDSKNIYNDPGLATTVENQPLYFDNQQTSGSGTSTNYYPNKASQGIKVSANTAGSRVRQTKRRFNYQPGKSQQIMMTFVFNAPVQGITNREGYFDSNNGIFLERDGNSYSIALRSKATGSPVDNRISQANWNLDKLDGSGKSEYTLDLSKVQIMIMDFEWLGTGRVRVGFIIDGIIVYAHEFLHANMITTVFMSTPNLPLRSEIITDGSNPEDSEMEQICSTVISEGGSEDIGSIRSASTNGVQLVAAVENTIYAILAIKLKPEYIDSTVKLLNFALQIQTSAHEIEWMILLNPTVASTFNYVGETNSAIQVARGATANTVTGGIRISGGFLQSGGVPSGASGSTSNELNNALTLGSLIDGTLDSIVLCVRPIGGSTNVDIEGALTWRELM